MRTSTDRRQRRLVTATAPFMLLASAAYAAAGGSGPAEVASVLVVGGSFLFGGLVAWDRRPGNRTGRLMVAAGLLQLFAPIGGPPLNLAPLSLLAGSVVTVLLGWLVLAFPSGELRSTASRAWLAVMGVVTFTVRFAVLAAAEDLANWGGDGPNPYQVIHDPAIAAMLRTARLAVVITIVTVLVAMVVARWMRSSGPARRALTPVLLAGGAVAATYLTVSLVSLRDLPAEAELVLLWVQDVSLALFPIGFLVGFLRIYMTRSAIADLVVELGETPTPAQLQTALSNALGDPTLTVAYWSAIDDAYVGLAGEPVTMPSEGDGRAVTRLERDGAPIAVILHDPALLDDPGLVASVASAMRLAVENERLQSEVERQLGEVRASRARIVEAGDAERKRLERDLHDGAQQRLVSLTLTLRIARSRLGEDADPALRLSLEQASEDARLALAELRELARGIHPAILTDAGLGAAVESLADRSVVPAIVEGAARERFAPVVERTAYFVVSEALANVNKYAHATRAVVRLGHDDACLTVEVGDDGVGGADPALGSGLRGLADRLAAIDGTIAIESPTGGGTRLVARIPIGASPGNAG